jgi:hypothetical protein
LASVLTHQGRAQIVNRIRGLGTIPEWIGWGTGPGVAAVTDTGLSQPSTEPRVQGATSSVTVNVAGDTLQCIGTLVVDATKTITNVGQFNAASGGEIFGHADFAGVVLNGPSGGNPGDGIQFVLRTVIS